MLALRTVTYCTENEETPGRARAAGHRTRSLGRFPQFIRRLTDLLRRAGSGECTPALASIVVLAGDIHNGSIAEVLFHCAPPHQPPTYQVVSSPVRNALRRWERLALMIAGSRPAAMLGRALLGTAGLVPPALRWRKLAGPWFDNHISTIEVRDRQVSIRVERAVGAEGGRADLAPLAVFKVPHPSDGFMSS